MKLEAYGSARAMLYAKRGGRPAKKAPKPKHANAGVPGLTAVSYTHLTLPTTD